MDKNELENLIELDYARLKRLKEKGSYNAIVERFEVLRLNFVYNQDMEIKDTIEFITLIKFIAKFGHSESYKLQAQLMYSKYIEKFNL